MEMSNLSSLCLESVADNIAMWCESAERENFYKYLYVIGPFNALGSKMIQQLLDMCCNKQLLKALYFPLLFHEGITKLDLSTCNSMVNDQVLKLVCRRSKKLTHLNLKDCSRLSTSCLNKTLPTLQSLRRLQLTNCQGCSDQLLINLGKHCRNLQELVVSLCPKVTDVGVEALLTNENLGEVGCFDILHLDVSLTSITTKCLSMILVRLPKLRKLGFTEITADGKDSLGLDGIYSLNIEYLDLTSTSLADGDLEVFIDHCLNLAVLKLSISSITRRYFAKNAMAGLSHLRSLELSELDETTDFRDLENLLEKRGDQLESLKLYGIYGVRISVICLHCRSLKELALDDCVDIDPTLPAFNNLTKEQRDSLSPGANGSRFSDFCRQLSSINLSGTFFCGYPSELLKPMLMSSLLSDHKNLSKLFLNNNMNMTYDCDEVLEQAVCGSSSSLSLQTLDLTYLGITVESVRVIIETCRNLRLLNLSHCRRIDLSSVSDIRKNLKKNRNPLQIVWI